MHGTQYEFVNLGDASEKGAKIINKGLRGSTSGSVLVEDIGFCLQQMGSQLVVLGTTLVKCGQNWILVRTWFVYSILKYC